MGKDMVVDEFNELCENPKDAGIISQHENKDPYFLDKLLTVEEFKRVMGYKASQLYAFIKDDVDGNEDK